MPVPCTFRRPAAPRAGDPRIGDRNRAVDIVLVGERCRLNSMGDELQTRQKVRRDEAPRLGAVAGPEGVELSIVRAGQDDPPAIGACFPEMAGAVLVERSRGVGIPEIFEVRGGFSYRDRRRAEDVAQLPVVRVGGSFAADVADQRIALGVRPDGQVLLGDVCVRYGKVLQRTALVGLHDAAGRRYAFLQYDARVPIGRLADQTAGGVDGEPPQMSMPERIPRDRLE